MPTGKITPLIKFLLKIDENERSRAPIRAENGRKNLCSAPIKILDMCAQQSNKADRAYETDASSG